MSRQSCRIFLLLAGLSLAVLSFGCSHGAHPEALSDRGVRQLTIFHLNDLHARLLPDDQGRGGFAHLATLLQREKAAAGAHLTLHAGDLVQGTPVSTLFEGLPIMEVTNRLGIDVHCLGNHELDYGWSKIPEFVEVSEFDTVSANFLDPSGATLVEPYVIREVEGLRVAVVGALTENLLDLTVSERLGPWRTRPLLTTLRPVVAEVRDKADLVVVLAHLTNGEAETILGGLPDVAVVVRGHGHGGWDEPIEVDGRIAVDAPGYGRALGRLRLTYDPAARRILSYDWATIPVDAAALPADPGVLELVEKWEARVSEIVDVPIGRSRRSYSREEVKKLIERAMLDRSDAELAYTNLGGVRDVLPKGEILARNIWTIMPFDNVVTLAEVPGKDLVQLRDPTSGDERVVEEDAVDPERTYRFVTTDFLAMAWKDRGIDLGFQDQGILLRDLLLEWVTERKVVP